MTGSPGTKGRSGPGQKFFGQDNHTAGFLPTMTTLTADERNAIGFAVGVLSTLAMDERLTAEVGETFGANSARLQALLDRARHV